MENEFLMILGKFGILEQKNRSYVLKTFTSGEEDITIICGDDPW